MGSNLESAKDCAGDQIFHEQISGFVMAGGRSSRLGLDKVLLLWNGQTLIEHAIARLGQVCAAVRVCANREDLQQYLAPSDTPIQDALPGAGPLAGIVAALEKSQTAWNFFLAVDLPLVPVPLLQALAARTASDDAANARTLCILPHVESLPQPLCGLYHRSLAPGLSRALKEGKYKITLALRDAAVDVEGRLALPTGPVGSTLTSGPALGTPASRVELFDVQGFAAAKTGQPALQASEMFLNINTSQELQRARELNFL